MTAAFELPAVRRPIMLRSELLAQGWTDREIRWRLSRGAWRQLRQGIYVETAVLDALADDQARTHALYVRAARLRLAGAVVAASFESAALLLGLSSLQPAPTTVHMTRGGPVQRHAQRYRALVVDTAGLPPEHLHPERIHGVDLTSAARTAVDLARSRDRRTAVVAADSALRLGLTTPAELAAVVDDVAGWPGAISARDVVAFADGRAESVMESVSRVALDECGLEPPDLQAVLGDDAGTTARVDFHWKAHHTVGEADGLGKYVDRADKVAERRRQEWLEDTLGQEVVRWTYEDLWGPRLLGLRRRIDAAFLRAHRRWGD